MAIAINFFTSDKFLQPGTNFSWQDKPWAEFSTLEVAACHAMHLLHSIAIRPNLELKTRSKQLLGSLPLDIMLPTTTLSYFPIARPLHTLLL
jgi:hypothetical protein